jgi:Rrf2 family cysteine metabolism transcriptional repressor
MRLSTRGEYGVRAMVALARVHGSPPLSLAALAQSEGISLSYLEQLFGELRRAGLVTAARGAFGGYSLSRPPRDITVGDVVRPLESVALTNCSESDAGAECCKRSPDCATRDFWQSVNARLADALDGTTLADLAESAASAAIASPAGPTRSPSAHKSVAA